MTATQNISNKIFKTYFKDSLTRIYLQAGIQIMPMSPHVGEYRLHTSVLDQVLSVKNQQKINVMKKNQNRLMRLIFTIACCIIATQAFSQASPLNMSEAVKIAIANNNSLKADSMNLLVTDYQNKVQKADLLPQVNYSGKTEYNPAIASQMLPGYIVGQPGKDYVSVPFGSRYYMGGGIDVSQTLLKKSTRIKVNAAGLNNSIAQTRYKLTTEDLVYQVATSFYALQANAELIKTTRSDYYNLKEILAIAKSQFENGTLKRIDYESLQINTANKLSYLNQLQTDYNDQLARFNYLLGIPADEQTVIDDHITLTEGTVDEGDLVMQREDIHLSSQLIESKEVEIKSIKAEALPVISSYFRFNYQSQFNDANNAFNSNYWYKSSTVGISASISLFDGYRRRNRVSVAQSQLLQLKFQDEQTKQLANTEWLTATEMLRKDQQQYDITSKNLGLAEKVFTSRKALYAQGVSTLVELLDAESELSESRNLHIQSMINVQTSMVNVYKSKGTLLTEYLRSIENK
jgi:outer membrane protein